MRRQVKVGRGGRNPNGRAVALLSVGGALLVGGFLAGRARIARLFNDRKLDGLHPLARARMVAFLSEVEARLGYTPTITSGYRTQAEQQRLQRAGNANAVSAGTSPHVYGLAIDANFTRRGARLHSGSGRAAWEMSGIPALARRHGLRWGGDFSRPDVVHFDYGWSPTIAAAKLNEATARFGGQWMQADLRQIV